MSTEIRVERSPGYLGNTISLYVIDPEARTAAVDCIMEPIKSGERIDPVIYLEPMKAQQLMDELWQCGLRPSEGSGSAGSLAATERHLEDMRAIVFDQLDTAKPGGNNK